jgi:hypothetical protein
MNWLRPWIRIEFGRPTFGGFMAGLVWGSLLGAIVALLTGWPMMVAVWVAIATSLVASLFVRSALDVDGS